MSDARGAVSIRGVSKRFGEVAALHALDLEIPPGSFFSLLGPSGCGKTTLLRIVAGLEMPDEGTVSSCEILDSVANLREYDWDFSKLWYSPAMEGRREQVANGCFCTHESNCYYPSLPFNPTHLMEIKKVEREMKASRNLLDRSGPSVAPFNPSVRTV